MAKPKTRPVNFRVDEEMYKRWTQAAAQSGLTLSMWIRMRCDNIEEIEVVIPRPSKAA